MLRTVVADPATGNRHHNGCDRTEDQGYGRHPYPATYGEAEVAPG